MRDSSFQALEVDHLYVMRDKTTILRDVSFAIKPGSITGLIGPSGSGKTTLMRAIIGAQTIRSGSIRVLGLAAGNSQLRHSIGYVSQAPSVYNDLTVQQNLRYFATIVGADSQAVLNVLRHIDLQDYAKRLVGSLSGGQKARVSLGIALLGDAQVLILDEPTVGLDPLLRRSLWDLFDDLAKQGKTLLISSHVMDEAERCPQLVLMRDGRLLSFGSRDDLLQRTHRHHVEDAFIALMEGQHAS